MAAPCLAAQHCTHAARAARLSVPDPICPRQICREGAPGGGVTSSGPQSDCSAAARIHRPDSNLQPAAAQHQPPIRPTAPRLRRLGAHRAVPRPAPPLLAICWPAPALAPPLPMDLLASAYGATSDDDDDDSKGPEVNPAPGCAPSDCTSPVRPPLKRPRCEPPQYFPPPPIPHLAQPRPVLPPSNSSSGRYVSKRERALLAASLSTMESASPLPPSAAAVFGPPVVGSISDSNLRADILHSLRCQPKCGSTRRWPLKLSVSLSGHTKAANSVDWSPSHGYDCSLRLVDVEEGKEIKVFKEDQAMEVIKFNPINPNLFLSGGGKGSLRLWDIRCGLVTKEYHRNLGTILDIEFSADGKQFISSTDTSRSNISENSIIIWDTLRQVPLSNQVYTEAYTCPCVRYHPYEACFVAQSNGNYIAMFSARPPFKLNKYMRFEGHGVWGFPIKCNFSLSGILPYRSDPWELRPKPHHPSPTEQGLSSHSTKVPPRESCFHGARHLRDTSSLTGRSSSASSPHRWLLASAFIIFLISVGSFIFAVFVLSIALVCAHDTLRVSEAFFLDEPDQANDSDSTNLLSADWFTIYTGLRYSAMASNRVARRASAPLRHLHSLVLTLLKKGGSSVESPLAAGADDDANYLELIIDGKPAILSREAPPKACGKGEI
ncbi:hypothetical protein GUJ93_ZPchr0011g27897 [Zizania palustris]|uniref:Uncharacterized protein n=1 Tax=Zizania palustris TaxID=103762 RepID=A0A8J5WMF5_ZIZPA|nr:hypothetical protein GUJ93_ZPchr0011g27897 [Zizania palustris]